MEALNIEASEDTPKIYFEPEVEIYLLEGKSLPENAIDFYRPVFDWAQTFFNSTDVPPSVVINFKFDYFNTASSKQIAKFLRIIENSPSSDNVIIKWYYDEEDTDMLKAGNRYNKLMNVHFEFVENKD
ncbi:MAG: DUF1987 domain-containing protein [Bacteroidota bacterium]